MFGKVVCLIESVEVLPTLLFQICILDNPVLGYVGLARLGVGVLNGELEKNMRKVQELV